ncbi:MAG: NUDIX hydrolase [Candidatus Sericytochromatia bacterium]
MHELPFDETILSRVLATRPRREISAEGMGRAAVLVPLFWREGVLHVLFTKRTDTVSTHKGQISFPGGRVEAHDETLLHTALRESHEEIGLAPEHVRVLGALDDTVTLRAMRITPYVGLIPEPYPFTLQTDEVAYLLDVPLAHFLDPSRLRIEEMRHPDGVVRPVHYYTMGSELIWGATARIVKEWLDAMLTPFDKPQSQA